jgi:hypothetical protein
MSKGDLTVRNTPRLRTVQAATADITSPPAAPTAAPVDTTEPPARHLYLVPAPAEPATRRMRPTIACLIAAGVTLPPR